jgi:F-type H+-transporting ATPase subunit a
MRPFYASTTAGKPAPNLPQQKLLTITPFIFPIIMIVLGLLTGMVQAYIFSILAAVYIAAATRVRKPKPEPAANH